MARPKKRTTTPETVKSTSFIDALKFVGAVTKDEGFINETHVHLYNGWVTASNGVLSAGHKITEEIFCAPNNKLLIEALSKCGEHLSITQLDNNRLSIKSDKFKAIVPCIDPILLKIAVPDMVVGIINDELKEAMKIVSVLVDENSDQIVPASILIQSGSCISSNGKIIFEYWHGIDLPTLAVSKAIVQPLAKCSKKLVKFGFSQNSITFYFEDESWFKTQLFADQWPDIKSILNQKTNQWPLPADFFKALDAVAPFSPDGLVHFEKDIMRSHDFEGTGASYELVGLPQNLKFVIKQLMLIKSYVKTIDWYVNSHIPMTIGYGDKFRFAIAGRK